MTEYIERLIALQTGYDTDVAHSEADAILCEILINLGYQEVVDAWELVNKWYA